MTSDDELRARLQRLDPAPPEMALDPSPSLRARQHLERAMTETTTASSSSPDQPTRKSRVPLMAAAAAAIAALSIGAVMLNQGGGTATPKPQSTLALKLPGSAGGGPAMNSCMMFDVSILKDMSPAFAGTVTSVSADSVTIDVDHWYTGGSADVVTLSQLNPSGPVSIEGGVTFEQGKRYLITAAEGTVNGCGYSGEATADLEAAFNQAFGG